MQTLFWRGLPGGASLRTSAARIQTGLIAMFRRTSLLTGGALLASPALAQITGDRPIRIIVPFPPGGSNDTVARIIQPGLAEILGRSIVVDNRAGASGSVGSTETARAVPDGNTWLLANDTLANNETLMSLPYRVMEAFTFCSVLGTCPYALTAHPSTPFRSVAEVIAAARSAPETLGYATTGVGSLAHIAAALLQMRGNFRLAHVPYRGGGPAMTDLLAGNVSMAFATVASTMIGALKWY
jgi:tripartite-type tricarboxylate transporter receptor subunit TctC